MFPKPDNQFQMNRRRHAITTKYPAEENTAIGSAKSVNSFDKILSAKGRIAVKGAAQDKKVPQNHQNRSCGT